MRKPFCALGIVLASFCALVVTAPGLASSPAVVAANRCNSQTVDEAFARVRDYDRHAPGGSSGQLLQRYAVISEVLSTLNEEREILESVCSSDAARAPLFAQIAATAAWALALESDVAGRLNATCPAAARALPTMMLADAWLSMARIVNDSAGVVPPIFSDVIPKVQTRAAAVGLTLPSWADTSVYWRDQVRANAKATVTTCPSPTPP